MMHSSEFEPVGDIVSWLWNCDMEWHDWKSGKNESFTIRIQKAMHYGDVRGKIFPRYVSKLGIKTCVYCNTQYALTHEDNTEVSAYYELDHAWPKSKYPYLAISFFNLQSCCGPCNKRKSAIDKKYSIYVDEPQESSVQFSITPESLIEYALMRKGTIKVELSVMDSNLETLYDKIGVKKMYNHMIDDAEEMVWKAKIYNASYLMQLSKMCTGLFINEKSNIFRLLYGVYAGEENVYKRPLTKFRQDIAKQLHCL